MEKYLSHFLTSIKEVLIKLGESDLRTILVVDDRKKVVGTVTDSDIRRAILDGISIDKPVEMIMNKNFIKVEIFKEQVNNYIWYSEQKQKLKKYKIKLIPIVDENGILIDVVKESLDASCDNPVVIMCGGLGSRMGKLTQNCPKPMLPINGKPMLEIIIERLIAKGFKNFYLAINYLGEQIENYFGDGDSLGITIKYLKENKRMGTGGALSLINKEEITSPLVVTNADVLTDFNIRNLLDFHISSKSCATMAITEHCIQNPFGVVKFNNTDFIDIEEKPIYKSYINSGVYIISPEFLNIVPQDTFIDMPTLLKKAKDEYDEKVSVYPILENWIDVGRPDDFAKVNSSK